MHKAQFSHKQRIGSRRLPPTETSAANNSTQYFTRRINKAFDHLCCRCCCLCPCPASVQSDELGRNGKRGENLHIPCSQVFLQGDAAAASLLVRLSSSDWHPHTFITNASQDKPELQDKPRTSASLSHLFAQLHAYRSRGPHFYGNPGLFWPAGWGSCYYFMYRWTLAQVSEMNELAKQMWFSIKKNAIDIVSDISVLCFTNIFSVEYLL